MESSTGSAKIERIHVWHDGDEYIDLVKTDSEWAIRSTVDKGRGRFKAAVDGMEALILALANAGIVLGGQASQDAVQTTLDAISNHYGE